MQQTKKPINTRFLLGILIMITALPVGAAWLLYHYHSHFQFKTVNHGVLISPPIASQPLWESAVGQKKWQIMYIPNDCNEQCEKQLFALHQIREALGKEAKRIHLAVVLNESCPLKEAYDFQKYAMTAKRSAELKQLLVQHNDKDFVMTNKIYLIDPMGNLFMYYPDTGNPMDILKDFKRLLEVSQVG